MRDRALQRLARAGQRRTPNRARLVDVLAASDRPVTIPEILDAAPGLAQSSVYRNLVVLEHAGVVHRIVTNDEFTRFELTELVTGRHHHHLVCVSCGSVADVPAAAGLERSVEQAADEIARTTGFHTEAHRIDLVGRCRRCA